MEVSQGSLLQPSLQDVGAARAPYSVKTLFITAFFGGPIAAIAIMTVNAVRLRRLIRDLAPILLALAAYVGSMTAVVATDLGRRFPAHRQFVRRGRLCLSAPRSCIGLFRFCVSASPQGTTGRGHRWSRPSQRPHRGRSLHSRRHRLVARA